MMVQFPLFLGAGSQSIVKRCSCRQIGQILADWGIRKTRSNAVREVPHLYLCISYEAISTAISLLNLMMESQALFLQDR